MPLRGKMLLSDTMTPEEHAERHKRLYFAVMELAAEWSFLNSQGSKPRSFRDLSAFDFVQWCYDQHVKPTEFSIQVDVREAPLFSVAHAPGEFDDDGDPVAVGITLYPTTKLFNLYKASVDEEEAKSSALKNDALEKALKDAGV